MKGPLCKLPLPAIGTRVSFKEISVIDFIIDYSDKDFFAVIYCEKIIKKLPLIKETHGILCGGVRRGVGICTPENSRLTKEPDITQCYRLHKGSRMVLLYQVRLGFTGKLYEVHPSDIIYHPHHTYVASTIPYVAKKLDVTQKRQNLTLS